MSKKVCIREYCNIKYNDEEKKKKKKKHQRHDREIDVFCPE